MNTRNYRNGRLSCLLLIVVLGISLFGCNGSQSSQQQAPTPAEQQKLKDEQAKAQKDMNTLTSGMGQSLSKTPTPPTTDPLVTTWAVERAPPDTGDNCSTGIPQGAVPPLGSSA